MTAEAMPAPNQAPSRMQRARELTGSTLHEVGTNPGLRAHAMQLGAEMLLGAGVLAQDSRGRRFSLGGFANALSKPKEAFSGAMERGAPHAAALAGHAGLVAVGHLASRHRANRKSAPGEVLPPSSQS